MPNRQQAILIVDDKPANLHALEQTLSELNVTVVTAPSGNDALTATLNHNFALCILDVQMPGMDGFELAGILKKDPKTHFLPIIFLTAALLGQEEMLKGYEVGAVDYVVKPYHPQVLLSKVRIFLQLDEQRTDLLEHHRQLEIVTDQLKNEVRAKEVKNRLIRQQAEAIVAFATPIIQVWEDIIVLPLIGTLDQARAEQLTSDLLQAIRERGAAVVIIDITGIPEIDDAGAAGLLRLVQAAKILGADCVLTGTRPQNARALATMDVDFGNLKAKGTLHGGLEYAFRLTQRTVVSSAC